MKTYKIYLNVLDEKKKGITQEQRTEILDKNETALIKKFGANFNESCNQHLPYFYTKRFYFGSPIVLNNVTEEEINEVLYFFSKNGFPHYWVTYKYRTYSLDEIKEEKININEVKTQNNNNVFLSDRAKIFEGLKNEVSGWINGKGNIERFKENGVKK